MGVDTAQVAGAGAGVVGRIDGEFEGADLGFFGEVAGEELVHGDVGDDLDFVSTASGGAGEKGAGSSGVDVVPVRLDAGEDEHLVAIRGERFEYWGEFEVRAIAFGRPVFHGHAVGDVEGLEALGGLGGFGLGAEHGVQLRQREGGSESAEERAARQGFI